LGGVPERKQRGKVGRGGGPGLLFLKKKTGDRGKGGRGGKSWTGSGLKN